MLIHPDVNARRLDYIDLQPNEARVTKIFYTIQGEGPFAGEPCVFVRLAGCNLGAKESCPWCDTYFELAGGAKMRVADILQQAEDLLPRAPGHRKLMVLTGGEPLLQNPHILVEYFLTHHWQVQIETNGYFWSEEMHHLAVDYFKQLVIVVSPKVNQRRIYPPLSHVLWMDSSCLKILLDRDAESPYLNPPYYAKDYGANTGKPVYVSPINHYVRVTSLHEPVSAWEREAPNLDLERCRRNHRYAAEVAKLWGWRLSLQMHLFAEQE